MARKHGGRCRTGDRREIDDILIYEAKMEIPRGDTGPRSRPAGLPDTFIPQRDTNFFDLHLDHHRARLARS